MTVQNGSTNSQLENKVLDTLPVISFYELVWRLFDGVPEGLWHSTFLSWSKRRQQIMLDGMQ